MLVVAGPNGAGKSTMTDHISIGRRIDPDSIARQMRPSAPDTVSFKAGREARQLVRQQIAQRQSFTVETTLSGKQVLRDMQAAKAMGFQVRLEFVGIGSVAKSAERVADRVAKGGHDIPADRIADRFPKVMANLPHGAALADETTIRDNSNKDFARVLHVRDGHVVERANPIPAYLRSAVSEIERGLPDRSQTATVAVVQPMIRRKNDLTPLQIRERMHEVNSSLDKMRQTLPQQEQVKFDQLRDKINDQMHDRLAQTRHSQQKPAEASQTPEKQQPVSNHKAKAPEPETRRPRRDRGDDFER